MMKTITVYYNGSALLLSQDYAELNGIKNGYRIASESEFWQILNGHAEHQIPKLKMLISAKSSVN